MGRLWRAEHFPHCTLPWHCESASHVPCNWYIAWTLVEWVACTKGSLGSLARVMIGSSHGFLLKVESFIGAMICMEFFQVSANQILYLLRDFTIKEGSMGVVGVKLRLWLSERCFGLTTMLLVKVFIRLGLASLSTAWMPSCGGKACLNRAIFFWRRRISLSWSSNDCYHHWTMSMRWHIMS